MRRVSPLPAADLPSVGSAPAAAQIERSRFADARWHEESPRCGDAFWAVVCPCVLLGRIESVLRREPVGPCGLGKRGAAGCVGACGLGPLSLARAVVQQRSSLMRTYGIPGGAVEQAKGLCVPFALAQHSRFVAERVDDGTLRWPWETSAAWEVASRPCVTTFEVVVLGAPGVGVSSLVRAMVGADAPASDFGAGAAGCFGDPSAFVVGARLVQPFGRPVAAIQFWDVPATPDVSLPKAFLEAAHAVIAVFNPDARESLEEAVARYEAAVGDARPAVRILLGNVNRHRADDDICEFLDDVGTIAQAREMHACLLALHTPSANGTKALLDELTSQLWRAHDAHAACPPPKHN